MKENKTLNNKVTNSHITDNTTTSTHATTSSNTTATVMAVHRDRYELLATEQTEYMTDADAVKLYARLKTTEFYNTGTVVEFPTVGDTVDIIYNPLGDSQITAVHPRHSVFLRLNATQGLPDQAVAANFDYVFITMSLNLDFNISKLERYLTVAWQSGGTPVIVLTKLDLCEDCEEYTQQVEEAAPGGIREGDAQGRHTTTYKQCIYLPEQIILPNGEVLQGGGRIIDTPGMRKLIVAEVDEGLSRSFDDIEELAMQCRFSDCQHNSEPGCAIQAALTDGSLSQKRYKTYLDMQREEAFSIERKKLRMKKIAKDVKQIKQAKKRR